MNCARCRRPVSTRYDVCPYCGYNNRRVGRYDPYSGYYGGHGGYRPYRGGGAQVAYYSATPKVPGIVIASMVLGICSVVFGAFILIGIPTGVLGIVFSVKPIKYNYHGKGMAIAGLACGAVGCFISLMVLIFVLSVRSRFSFFL